MKRLALMAVALVAFALSAAAQDILPQQVEQQINNFSSDLARLKADYEGVAQLITRCMNTANTVNATYAEPVGNAAALTAAMPDDLSLKVLASRAASCSAVAASLQAEINNVAACVGYIQKYGATQALAKLAELDKTGTPVRSIKRVTK